jgi:hypothetical protein
MDFMLDLKALDHSLWPIVLPVDLDIDHNLMIDDLDVVLKSLQVSKFSVCDVHKVTIIILALSEHF